MKQGYTAISLAALLALCLCVAALAQQQPSAVPDAPAPQAHKPLADVNGPITPGKGAGDEQPSGDSSSTTSTQQPEPASQTPPSQVKDTVQTSAPDIPPAGEGYEKISKTIHVYTNFVEVPVTVKDSHQRLVAGLTYRDFKVFENDT
ncbi:MAG: hypothetical protein ABR907_10710, partial [Terracidiphilus sp.]